MASAATAGNGWLTVPEAPDLLRVSRPTVYREVACGVIPAVKVGPLVRIPADGLEEFLQRSTVRPSTADSRERP